MVTPAFESGVIFSSPSASPEPLTNRAFRSAALDFVPPAQGPGKDRLIVALVSALVVLIPAVLRYRNFFVEGEAELDLVFGAIYCGVAVAAFLYLGLGIFSRAIEDLKGRRISVEALASFAAVLLIWGLVFEWALIRNGISIQTLASSLILICSVTTIENFFSGRIYSRIRSAIGFNLLEMVPRVRVIESMVSQPEKVSSGFELGSSKSGIEEGWTDLRALNPGQLLRIREGDLIPADGLVQDGVAKVLERRVGGVGRMKLKARGDELFAGSLLLRGEVTLKVISSAEDSMITTFAAALGRSLMPSEAEDRAMAGRLRLIAGVIVAISLSAVVYHVLSGATVSGALAIGAAVLPAVVAVRALVLSGLLAPLLTTRLFFNGVLVKDRGAFERLLKVRSLAVESPVPGEKYEFGEFELLDDRLQKVSVLSVFLALVSRSEDELFVALSDLLIRREKELVPLEVQDGHVYRGLGVCGTINKVEFSAGSEEFLIERGVQLQPCEMDKGSGGSQVVYLAMDDAVIGKISILRDPFSSGRGMVSDLRKEKVTTVLCSPRGSPINAQEAHSLGIDSVNVASELSPSGYLERLQSLRPAAILASPGSGRELIAASEVSFSLFDTFAWKLDRTDFTLFTRNVQVVLEALRLAKLLKRVSRVYLPLAFGISAAVAGLAWFSVVDAGASIILSALVHFVLLGLVWMAGGRGQGNL